MQVRDTTVPRRAGVRALVIGVVIALGTTLLVGSAAATPRKAPAAAAPKEGGSITYGLESETGGGWCPTSEQLAASGIMVEAAIYDTLVAPNDKNVMVPNLAKSVDHNADYTVWTIKLRDGIKFHDGTPLTADDVVFSLARHKDPATGSAAKALAAPMKEITASGKHEVKITLESPNADLPVVLGTPHFLIIKNGTSSFTTAIGTGPYRCQEFQPGIKSIGVRNTEYFKPGQPYLDEIELFGIPDQTARLNALLSGDVQIAVAISPQLAKRVQASPGFAVFETKAGGYNDLVIRQDSDPGRNQDLVLALKYLLNREQMKSAVFQGYAVLANDQPIDPTNRFYFPGLKQRPFDAEKAKFHLQRSGVGNTTVPLHAMASSTMLDQAVLIQQAAQQIGLNVDVKRMPADGYWSNVWMKQPLTMGSINPRPSADVLFTLFFKSDSTWNESAWKNEKFDQLLVGARGERDEAKRKQMYGEMQTLVHESCGIGLPVFISILDAHTAKLKGLKPIPTGGLMGYAYAENVWLES
jgi:peptide/nickel transport system substrate-binding protein